jgi:hypothetical protein
LHKQRQVPAVTLLLVSKNPKIDAGLLKDEYECFGNLLNPRIEGRSATHKVKKFGPISPGKHFQSWRL